jgi:hypothetical protein
LVTEEDATMAQSIKHCLVRGKVLWSSFLGRSGSLESQGDTTGCKWEGFGQAKVGHKPQDKKSIKEIFVSILQFNCLGLTLVITSSEVVAIYIMLSCCWD